MYKQVIKPFFDIFFALLISPFVGVLLLFVAPLVHMEDKGPVFYKARRIGKEGKIFTMYKIRSMKVDAKDIRLADGSTFNSEDDDRQTKIGRFLRKTSIDELPQVWNIIKGDMSFIGPRPDPEDWLDKYDDRIRYFLTVKPGITGYTQAMYRCEADGKMKMECDLYYAQHISFLLDLKIFFRTIYMVVMRKSIYKNVDNSAD